VAAGPGGPGGPGLASQMTCTSERVQRKKFSESSWLLGLAISPFSQAGEASSGRHLGVIWEFHV
jgi:hypothetical protein